MSFLLFPSDPSGPVRSGRIPEVCRFAKMGDDGGVFVVVVRRHFSLSLSPTPPPFLSHAHCRHRSSSPFPPFIPPLLPCQVITWRGLLKLLTTKATKCPSCISNPRIKAASPAPPGQSITVTLPSKHLRAGNFPTRTNLTSAPCHLIRSILF